MSELQRFLPADQELLVSLFYRIGQWMSEADDTDTGTKSEQVEENAMFKILAKLAQSSQAGGLCSDIASESMRQKGSWARWSKQVDSVLEDVARAKTVIKDQGTVEEFHLFGKSLVTIATSVARAYRESTDMESHEIGFLSWLTEKSSHVSLAVSDREAHKDLNISPAEDSALNELVAVLKS